MSALDEQIAAQKATISRLTSAMNAVEADIAAVNADIATVNAVNAEIAAVNAEIAAVNAEIAALREQIDHNTSAWINSKSADERTLLSDSISADREYIKSRCAYVQSSRDYVRSTSDACQSATDKLNSLLQEKRDAEKVKTSSVRSASLTPRSQLESSHSRTNTHSHNSKAQSGQSTPLHGAMSRRDYFRELKEHSEVHNDPQRYAISRTKFIISIKDGVHVVYELRLDDDANNDSPAIRNLYLMLYASDYKVATFLEKLGNGEFQETGDRNTALINMEIA